MSKLLAMMRNNGGAYMLNTDVFTKYGTNIVVDETTGNVSGFTSRPNYNYIYMPYINYFGLDKQNKIIFSVDDSLFGCIISLGARWNFHCWNHNFRYCNANGNSEHLLYNNIQAYTRYRVEFSGNFSGETLQSISWTLYNDETDTSLANGTITELPNSSSSFKNILVGIKYDSYGGHMYQDGFYGTIYAGTIVAENDLVIRG